jgi:hypothetical protein
MNKETYDIVFSFDTTGSMYPCLSEVKRNLKDLLDKLLVEVPNLRIGIIAHGDYCDENNPYLIKMMELTNDKEKLINFINTVESTSGGDYEEAYEYVLHKALELNWESKKMRALVIIGDAPPHEKNKYNLDWREECKKLFELNVNIYTIQCLNWNNNKATEFYKHLAKTTNGYYLNLNQFSNIKDILIAVCYKQYDDSIVKKYEEELRLKCSGLTKNMQKIFDTILNRPVNDDELDYDGVDYDEKPIKSKRKKVKTKIADETIDDTVKPCNPAKFQIFNVDNDMSIKSFVLNMGLTFKTGKGFYEFTKAENISANKEIILMDKTTGDLFEGGGARKLAKIESSGKLKPEDIPNYRVFVQSTSVSRKLLKNTGFLYEVADFGVEI